MSFGFSVGDLIGAGNLTYQLIKALHSSQDAGDEYRAAINELGCMQQAFMRVSCLGANPNISQATFESASCIVMGSMDIIKSFLEKTKRYDRRLGGGMGMSGLALNLRKVGWTLFKADDMKKLREALQSRLAALSVLLMAANLEPDGAGKVETFMEGEEQHVPASLGGAPNFFGPSRQKTERTHPAPVIARETSPARTSHSIDSAIGSEEASPKTATTTHLQSKADDNITLVESNMFSLSLFSSTELRSLITDSVCRSEKIKEVSELLRTLVLMGDCQLIPSDRADLIRGLDKICGSLRIDIVDGRPKPPIKFKDAVGRKFSFPWHLCKTWKGMEELIKQAFLHVDIIGPHVHEGHYDLVGPDGEIILPQVWETMIQPDWAITMHMWPMPEPPPPPKDLPPPPAAPLALHDEDINSAMRHREGARRSKKQSRNVRFKSAAEKKVKARARSHGLPPQPPIASSVATIPSDTRNSKKPSQQEDSDESGPDTLTHAESLDDSPTNHAPESPSSVEPYQISPSLSAQDGMGLEVEGLYKGTGALPHPYASPRKKHFAKDETVLDTVEIPRSGDDLIRGSFSL